MKTENVPEFKVGDWYVDKSDSTHKCLVKSTWRDSIDVNEYRNGQLWDCPRLYKNGFKEKYRKLTPLELALL